MNSLYVNMCMRRVMVCILWMSALVCLKYEAQEFKRGVLIPEVMSASDPNQRFTIYLPTAYDPAKKWPILYAFSPNGEDGGARFFKDAAENLGWIIIGSQNSKNGVDNRPAMKAMWKDSFAMFSIDKKRLYASGMSGGARQAMEFAVMNKRKFAGIISCGAVARRGYEIKRKSKIKCVLIAGDKDYNYLEMVNYQHALNKKGVENRLYTFAGGHVWPPPAILAHAMRYLELWSQVVQKKKGRDLGRITALVSSELKYLQSVAQDKTQWYLVYEEVNRLSKMCKKMAKTLSKEDRVVYDQIEEYRELLELDPRFVNERQAYRAFVGIHTIVTDVPKDMLSRGRSYINIWRTYGEATAGHCARARVESIILRIEMIMKYNGAADTAAYKNVYDTLKNELRE